MLLIFCLSPTDKAGPATWAWMAPPELDLQRGYANTEATQELSGAGLHVSTYVGLLSDGSFEAGVRAQLVAARSPNRGRCLYPTPPLLICCFRGDRGDRWAVRGLEDGVALAVILS